MKTIKEIIDLWKNYHTYKVYVCLLFVCFIKQLFNYAELVDSREYLAAAQNLLHKGFPDSCLNHLNCEHWLNETRRTLGYPLLIVVVGFLKPLLLLFQCFIAALMPLLSSKLIQKLGYGKNELRIFMWFLLLYPLQYFYSNLLMPEVLCQALVLCLILAVIQKKWHWIGIITAALILLKPVFVILFPILLLVFFKSPLKRWGLIIPFMFFLMVSFWNYKQTGLLHYSSMATENTWEYNQKAVLNQVEPVDGENSVMQIQTDSLRNKTFAEKYTLMNQLSKATISNHWQVYLWLHTKGTLLAMIDPGRYDLVAFFKLNNSGGFMGIKEDGNLSKFTQQPPLILAYLIVFTLLNILKWILFVPVILKNIKNWWWIWLPLLMLIAVTGPVGSARYLFPIMPVVIIFAAVGLNYFLKKHEKNSVVK